ncbi:MAG TPA: DUF748 domain-containing protein [Elusimicrobiota bacterium]|nr:DUF748 domain-containing protein [Elusimicrobiota bacterium]
MRAKAKKSRSTVRTVVIVVAAVVVAALVALRLALPGLARREVDAKLSSMDNYVGAVDSVGIHLWRGAYSLDGLAIDKKGGAVPVPFFSADKIDLSVEWKALLHRRIVAKVKILKPVLNFVKGPTPESSAAKPDESMASAMKSLTPFDIDRLTVTDGQIRYRDFKSSPTVNIALTDIQAVALNLRNTEQTGVELPADIRVKAKAFGSGDLSIDLKANPLKETPTFELKQTLQGVELTKLNDFFDAYAKLKVKKGTFGLYTESAAKDGKFVGYVEPFIKDMVIDKGRKNPVKDVWGVVASAVKWVFSNKSKKQLATKLPVEGTFEKTQKDYLAAAEGILENAYIKALTPKVENLGLKDVEKVRTKGERKAE